MANEMVTFSGAKLPAKGLAHFKKALQVTSEVAKIEGGIPFLRLVKGSGLFVYGPNDIEVEEGSHWAINPLSMQIGFIAWKGGKPVGKRMKTVMEAVATGPITRGDLSDVGADWDENISFRLMCIHGEDKGVEVEYQANSYGGKKAFSDLVEEFKAQVDADPDHIVPVVEMESKSYDHNEYGKVHNPIFKIVKWVAMDGGAAEAEQPDASEPEAKPKAAAPQPKQETVATPTRRRAAAPVTDVEEQPEAPAPKADAPDPVVRRRRRAA